jgi:hypothetical protein
VHGRCFGLQRIPMLFLQRFSSCLFFLFGSAFSIVENLFSSEVEPLSLFGVIFLIFEILSLFFHQSLLI